MISENKNSYLNQFYFKFFFFYIFILENKTTFFCSDIAAFKSNVMLEKANYCHKMNVFFSGFKEIILYIIIYFLT